MTPGPTPYAVEWHPLPNGLPSHDKGYLILVDRYESPTGLVTLYLPTLRRGLFLRQTMRAGTETWEAGIATALGRFSIHDVLAGDGPL